MDKIYTRKLTMQKNSFMLTIPKDVVIDLSLSKGVFIDIQVRNGQATIVKHSERKKIFTIGYSGKSIDEILSLMHKNHIKQLIDVRQTPFSWKSGFSKAPLSESISSDQLEYLHLPKLGAPKQIRKEIKENNNPELFFDLYKEWLSTHDEAFLELDRLATDRSSVIMCVEKDYHDCHRSVLSEKLANKGFEVIHL